MMKLKNETNAYLSEDQYGSRYGRPIVDVIEEAKEVVEEEPIQFKKSLRANNSVYKSAFNTVP